MKVMILFLILMSGCSSPKRTVIAPDLYRFTHCDSNQEHLQCARMMETSCPNGYHIIHQVLPHRPGIVITCE